MASPTRSRGEDDPVAECGLFFWRPKWLQQFASAKAYLFCLCLAGSLQSLLVNGLINVSISTIEKRFELTSTDTGFIVGTYDIASFIFVLPISYIGGQIGAIKPRWIGCGILLLGLGTLIFALPHLAAGLYQALEEENNVAYCGSSLDFSKGSNTTGHRQTVASLQNLKYFFFIAQLIMGIGGSPLYTLGITFLDENVSNKMQPLYTGIFYACTTLGPAIGYVLGGQFLRIYVDFLSLSGKEIGLTPGSSSWVGAWWIGFVLIGILLIISAIPLFAFPGILKDPDNSTETGVNFSQHEGEKSPITLPEIFKQLPQAIKKLGLNYTFLLISLEEACETFLLAGFSTFLPKIIENQFGLSSVTSSLIVGGIVIPCGCGGAFLGGYLIKYFEMDCRAILKFSMILVGLSFCCSFTFIVYCPTPDFAGLNHQYLIKNHSEIKYSLESECNSNCVCSMDVYDPVCGIDNLMYYSPCHAGCTETSGNSTMFSNCSCVFADRSVAFQREVMASRQKCKSSCNNLYGFIVMLFIFLAITMMNSMPPLSATLRCTDPNQRTFALGVQMLIWRLLGSIPGPILFGLVIDRSCLLWQTTGGMIGSCLVYDNKSLSRVMVGLSFIGKGLAFFFSIMAWWVYNPAVDPTKAAEETVSDENTEGPIKLHPYAYDNTITSEE